MIGQEKLLSRLKNYTVDTLPHTLLFIGEEGCGKHLVINQLAYNNYLEMVDVNKDIDYDKILEYQLCPIRKLYVINLKDFNEKQQNKLLKFIEEPSSTAYIALLAESEIGILDTIINRCIKFIFEPYTEEQLRAVDVSGKQDDLLYKICKTPGQVIWANHNDTEIMFSICHSIAKMAGKFKYINLLSVTEKINTGNNCDKFDFRLFFNTILYLTYNEYASNGNEDSLALYLFTVDYLQRLVNKTLVKENFLLNYFTSIWEALA